MQSKEYNFKVGSEILHGVRERIESGVTPEVRRKSYANVHPDFSAAVNAMLSAKIRNS